MAQETLPTGQTNPDFIASAASSALPTAAQEISRPPATSPANIQQLLQLLGGGGISGPLTTMRPELTTPSIPPHFETPGAAQIPQGTFGSVGERQRADYQATLNNLASFGKAATDYLHQKKVREYSMTMEKVMSAQAGLSEAQQALQAAQASKDPSAIVSAQEAIQHNQEILGTLFADPKTGKMIQKAFNVKLIGDDKGKATPEYQALQQALKSKDQAAAKTAGLNLLKRFQSQMPSRQQLNPQIQALMQLTQAGVLPKGGERLAAQTELTKVFTEAEQKGYDRASKEKISETLAGARDRATQATIVRQVLANTGRQGVAEIMANAARYRADTQAKAMVESAQWRAAGQILAKKTGVAAQDKAIANISKEHQRITDEIKDAQKELTALGQDEHWWRSSANNKKISDTKAKLDSLRQAQSNLVNRMNQLNLGAEIGGAASTESGGASGEDSGFTEFDKFFESAEGALLGGDETSDKQ